MAGALPLECRRVPVRFPLRRGRATPTPSLAIQELLGVEPDTIAADPAGGRREVPAGGAERRRPRSMPAGRTEPAGCGASSAAAASRPSTGPTGDPRPGAHELIVHAHHTEGGARALVSDELAACLRRSASHPGSQPRRIGAGPGAGKATVIGSPPPARGRAIDLGVVCVGDGTDDRERRVRAVPDRCRCVPARAAGTARTSSRSPRARSSAPLFSTISSARSPCWRVLISTWPPSTLCRPRVVEQVRDQPLDQRRVALGDRRLQVRSQLDLVLVELGTWALEHRLASAPISVRSRRSSPRSLPASVSSASISRSWSRPVASSSSQAARSVSRSRSGRRARPAAACARALAACAARATRWRRTVAAHQTMTRGGRAGRRGSRRAR